MSEGPVFPPLLTGRLTAAVPIEAAVEAARAGSDPGLLLYDVSGDLSAAVVLAPEVALGDAMAMVMAAGIGFSDALGAISPPEVAVHLEWPGGLRVNGGIVGGISVRASSDDETVVPDWLVVGIDVRFEGEPEGSGREPETTALWLEGCGDVTPEMLLESWARHFLVWVHEWETEGMQRLHDDWLGRAWSKDEAVTVFGQKGVFKGLDERGGLLLGRDGGTDLVPLARMLT